MSEPHGVPEQARLSPTQRSNLVAYLDGELAPEQTEDLDRVLARSHTARREVDLLTRTWEMLDLLDRPHLPEDFSTRTLERIETEAVARQLRGEKWRRGGRWAALCLGWLASVAAAAVIGFVAMHWSPNDSRALLDDLPVIEDLDQLRAVGDFEFLKQLYLRGEFAPEAGDSPDSAMRVDASGESLDERRRRVAAMPADAFDRLRRNYRQFHQSSSAEQDRLRRLDAQVHEQTDRARLQAVMENYAQWVRALPPPAREDLLSTPPDERLAKVDELRARAARTRAARGRPFQGVREPMRPQQRWRWIEPFVEGKLTEQQRSELQEKKRPGERMRAILEHVRRLGLLGGTNPLGPDKLSREELHEIVNRIGQDPSGLAEMPESKQREILGWRLRLWAVRLTAMLTPLDDKLPSIPDAELQAFLTEEVRPIKLAADYFDRRPGRLFHRDLTILFLYVHPEKRPESDSP